MNKLKERDIQREIIKYLRIKQIFCWKNNSVGIYVEKRKTYIPVGMKGISDIIGLLPTGQLFAIEVKVKNRYPNQNQKDFMQKINDSGGLAFVARSLDDVDKYI